MSYQIQCSTCGKKLLVREHSLGKKVRCSSCKTEFIAEAGPGEEIAEEHGADAVAPRPPAHDREDAEERTRRRDEEGPDSRDRPRRPRDDDRDEDDSGSRRRERDRDRPDSRRSHRRDRDEEEDEEDRPRRRPRDEEDEKDEGEDQPRKRRRRRRAEDVLETPAFWLQIVAYAGGGLSALLIVMYLVGMLEISEGIPGWRRAFFSFVWAIVAAVWVALVSKGAGAMSTQQSYGLAITGCIVAMLPLTPGFLGGLPIGIWCLVILLQDDIRQQFH